MIITLGQITKWEVELHNQWILNNSQFFAFVKDNQDLLPQSF